MKKKTIKITIIILCAIFLILEFTPLNVSQFLLNDAQKECLLNELIDVDPDDWGDEHFKNCAVVGSLDILGITGLGNRKTIYGYLNEGLYVEAQGKGYEISGGLFEFMVDIEINGDEVKVVKEYGDGVSTQSTIDEMPLNYRCKWYLYVSMQLYQMLLTRTRNKVIDKLGVPADKKYTLNIDDETGTYEIYDMDENNNVIVKYKGKTKELIKPTI